MIFAVEILLTTFKAIITVYLVYLAGFMLVKLGKINQPGVAVLSSVTNFLFLPALTFFSFASGLDAEILSYSAVLVGLGVFLTLYYMAISNIVLVPIAKPTPRFKRWFILGSSVVNYVALPLILLNSFCSQLLFEKPEIYQTDLEKLSNDTVFFEPDECYTRAELYAFLFSSFVSLISFTIGWEYAKGTPSIESLDVAFKNVEEPQKSDFVIWIQTLTPKSFVRGIWGQFLEQIVYRPFNSSKVLAVIVALIPGVKALFFGDDPLLKPVTDTINILQAPAISVINIVVACSLGIKLLSLPSWKSMFGDEENLGISTRALLLFAFGRMVIIPGLTYTWFYYAVEYLLPEEDKLMKLVAHLELFVPTSNTIVLLAQLLGQVDNAQVLATTTLLQYAIGFISVPLYSFLAIYLLDIEIA